MMKKKKIAITGGIGSGKSTVLTYLQKIGYPVFSCDEIYKEIIISPNYIEKIQKNFPTAVKNGKIDKNILSKLVFSDKNAREKLNQLAHPLIMQDLFKRMEKTSASLVFAEVPLLFEEGYENKFDGVIVIKRGETERILSIKNRDNSLEEDIRQRIQSQFNYDSNEGELKIKNCNAFVIENNADLKNLNKKMDNILLNL